MRHSRPFTGSFPFLVALFLIASALGTSLLLSGCGSGTGTTPIAATRQQQTGSARFAINWPTKTEVSGRLIPLATQSIHLRLTTADGKSLLGDTLLVRPGGGGPASTTFTNVPIGAATLSATASPNPDGTGVPLASAQTPVTVVQNQTTTVNLTLASTIQKLTVTPAISALSPGGVVSLTAAATDAAGSVVLFTPATLTWSTSASSVATVDVTGKVTAVSFGTATITATETESGVSGTATITIHPPAAATISFASPQAYNLPGAQAVITADFDGDGNIDIAAGSLTNSSVFIFWGHGDGTFDPAVAVYTTTGDLPGPSVVADMNNDGRPDIVCGDSAGSKVFLLLNTGSRTFASATTLSPPNGMHYGGPVVADFNGDGKLDIAAESEQSTGGGGGFFTVYLNNGSGGFTIGATYAVGSYAEGITTGDVNGDGKPDIVTSFLSGSGGAQVFLGKGDGTFTPGSRYTTATQNVPCPVLADFNRDGKLDLGVDNYFDNNMSVLFGNGDGTFQTASHYPDSPYPLQWQAVDLDGDGYLDMVTANAGSGVFTVLRNQGNGLFGTGVQYSSGGSNTRTCATADFNHDGRPDLVFGCESSNTIEVLLNTSH